ncbi:hypothetical protein [Candidatus Odyssella acanthamoebae]|uniref:hypothetical protein n=1 Tax=Candidatus Odyssella acanthamoebae TaxID=91604 RepID=UPI0012EB7652|nr:hypothetical protein [Candidatus Paracaedibacter acanthamoebae]
MDVKGGKIVLARAALEEFAFECCIFYHHKLVMEPEGITVKKKLAGLKVVK